MKQRRNEFGLYMVDLPSYNIQVIFQSLVIVRNNFRLNCFVKRCVKIYRCYCCERQRMSLHFNISSNVALYVLLVHAIQVDTSNLKMEVLSNGNHEHMICRGVVEIGDVIKSCIGRTYATRQATIHKTRGTHDLMHRHKEQ